MKKITLIASVFWALTSLAQNTFPTTGSVGIGTTSPTNQLQVVGSSRFDGAFKLPSIAEANLSSLDNFEVLLKTPTGDILKSGFRGAVMEAFKEPVGIDYCSIPGYSSTPYWMSGTGKLFVPCPDIFVGINTTAPLFHLHVSGTSYAKKSLLGNSLAPTNALFNGFAQGNSQDLIQLGVKIGAQAEEVRFKITNDGTVFAREIRVRQVQDFPDYVFALDYSLMPLSELENFILTYRHLPNMPTAEQVKENGADIGEIQRVLVEKVEELTLYNIQLNKENQELNSELEALKKEIAAIKAALSITD